MLWVLTIMIVGIGLVIERGLARINDTLIAMRQDQREQAERLVLSVERIESLTDR